MQARTMSKSKFKARALETLREVERTGMELVLTDRGRPVVRILPYSRDPAILLGELRGTVTKYVDPTEPLDVGDWEALA